MAPPATGDSHGHGERTPTGMCGMGIIISVAGWFGQGQKIIERLGVPLILARYQGCRTYSDAYIPPVNRRIDRDRRYGHPGLAHTAHRPHNDVAAATATVDDNLEDSTVLATSPTECTPAG